MSDLSTPIPVAGDEAALVRRYVGSLYALAEQEKAVDAVASDLEGLRQLWHESVEWRFVALDPRLPAEAAAQAVAQVAKISGIGQLTAHFLAVAAQNRRLPLLPAFIEGFLAEVVARRGEYRAEVHTARALSAAQREALLESLTGIAGGKVHMKVTEDASLLGGLTVKLGAQFIDASVKTKLDHLERSLKANAA